MEAMSRNDEVKLKECKAPASKRHHKKGIGPISTLSKSVLLNIMSGTVTYLFSWCRTDELVASPAFDNCNPGTWLTGCSLGVGTKGGFIQKQFHIPAKPDELSIHRFFFTPIKTHLIETHNQNETARFDNRGFNCRPHPVHEVVRTEWVVIPRSARKRWYAYSNILLKFLHTFAFFLNSGLLDCSRQRDHSSSARTDQFAICQRSHHLPKKM